MEVHGWCKSKFSNQKTPSRKRGGPSILQVFNSHGTSHLDGAVTIGQTGNNSFINCKLLIDTGALVPMSIAISEEFFVVRWGETRKITSFEVSKGGVNKYDNDYVRSRT